MSRSKPKLWGKISSDCGCLSKLQVYYKWVPSAETVRPSEAGKLAKQARLDQITDEYTSMRDYIDHTVFGCSVNNVNDTEKISVEEVTTPDLVVFKPNEFPYQIEQGNHYVLWYAVGEKPKGDEAITEDIVRELGKLVDGNSFDFAWYENPKPSIIERYHVQVFWTMLD